jgi:outer membrane protein assembly factor BamB
MNPKTALWVSTAMAASSLVLGSAVCFLLGRLTGLETPSLPAAYAAPSAPAGPGPEDPVSPGCLFTTFGGKPGEGPGSWPGFRGPHRNGICPEGVPLSDRWPTCGPKLLWSADLGEGCGGAAVHRGRVYVSDYDRESKEEQLRCFSLETGREIWRRSHRISITSYHGVSRTVPAVSDRFVVLIGPKCHVVCVDAATGALLWGLDLVKEFGADVPLWYTGQCALLDGGTAVLAPAGRGALLVGVDCATGAVLWKTPNPNGWKMSHASVMPMILNGRRAYVYGAEWGKVVAVSAERADAGEVLWTWGGLGKQVFVPSPLALGEGRLFLTSLYGAGSAVIDASAVDARKEATTVSLFEPGRSLASDLHTPILHDGLLYGIQSGDAGATRNQFVCMNPRDGGTIVWTSGKDRRFSPFGPFLLADGKFILFDAEGCLTLVRRSPSAYEELARFKLPDWHDSRAPMAIADGRLILRDDRRMICLDLKSSSSPD